MSTSQNIFLDDSDSYKRAVDPLKHYLEQCANFLHISSGKPLIDCINFVKEKINKHVVNNELGPKVMYLERNEFGDREKKQGLLIDYINNSIKDREILAPTLTSYLHPDVIESASVQFVDDNIKERGVAKKLQFKEDSNGNKNAVNFYRNKQTSKKTLNNSMSGAFCTPSNVLYNKTAHSTLTSNCRIMASYGNANNEKIVTGNRHYWSPNIVINNIVSIITNTNYEELKETIDKYSLYLPTSQDAINCITYSTNLYWNNTKSISDIKEFLDRLNPLQLAAFIYTGDLYHIKKHNELFIKNFIKGISTKCTDKVENPRDIIHKLNEEILILAHQICNEEVKGLGKKYNEMSEEVLSTLISTYRLIDKTLNDHALFIKAFFRTSNIPASIAYIPNSIRRCVTTSDTDSTIFTVQDWVKWGFGDYVITPESKGLAGSVIFFAAQTITHTLATVSANLGFARKNLHTIAMKSEFYWPVFVNTSVAKHYFALCEIQEGNVYGKYKNEIKGIHLKSSNSPKRILAKANELMNKIMYTVNDNKKLSITEILSDLSIFETSIKESLLKGELDFYRIGKIKEPSAYTKSQEDSPYQHYLLWRNVFSNHYGNISAPPYGTIKVPTTLDNVTKLNAWVDSIENQELRMALSEWLIQHGKTNLPTLYLPIEYVSNKGIPDIIKPIIDSKKIILDLCNIFYIILESLGFYKKSGRILSDFY